MPPTATLTSPRTAASPDALDAAVLDAAALAAAESLDARPGYALAKRALDVAVAGLALLLLSPLLLLAMLLVKLQDGGPAIFSQVRVGKGGRPFRFYKLRSMSLDAEARRAALKEEWEREQAESGAGDVVRFKLVDDPRVTRVGRWLRRTSMDELPQLLNVLLGDMSLVGPRPPIPEEVAEYGPRELLRLQVEQGITCLWQVSGRSTLPFEQQVELDLEYIRTRGLLTDLGLLLRTIPAVLHGRGAY